MSDRPYSSNNDDMLTRDEEREIDVMIEQALKQIERGEDVQTALSYILSYLPEHLQRRARQRFAVRLEERKNKTREREAAPIKAATSFKDAITLIARRTLEKIAQLLKSRPDVQRRILEAGNTLLRNGVAVDMTRVSEADLGNLPPVAGIASVQQQETARR